MYLVLITVFMVTSNPTMVSGSGARKTISAALGVTAYISLSAGGYIAGKRIHTQSPAHDNKLLHVYGNLRA